MTAVRLHALAPEALAEQLQSDATRGLGQAEAQRRLTQHGPNTLVPAPVRTTLAILVGQFKSLIVALLIAAGAIAFALDKDL